MQTGIHIRLMCNNILQNKQHMSETKENSNTVHCALYSEASHNEYSLLYD